MTPEEGARRVLDIYVHSFNLRAGGVLRVEALAAALHNLQPGMVDLYRGTEYAGEQGWIEVVGKGEFRLTAAGFAAAQPPAAVPAATAAASATIAPATAPRPTLRTADRRVPPGGSGRPAKGGRLRIRLLLLAMSAVGIGTTAVVALLGLRNPVSLEQWAKTHDPVLAQLFALNPGMDFEDEPTVGRGHAPFYWIKIPGSADHFLLPQTEAGNAHIRAVSCDWSAIPGGLVYPKRSDSACFEIGNDTHRVHALCFQTTDGLLDLIRFYDLQLPPKLRKLRVAMGDHVLDGAYRRDDTGELVFSYMYADEGYRHVYAFVAYGEERNSAM